MKTNGLSATGISLVRFTLLYVFLTINLGSRSEATTDATKKPDGLQNELVKVFDKNLGSKVNTYLARAPGKDGGSHNRLISINGSNPEEAMSVLRSVVSLIFKIVNHEYECAKKCKPCDSSLKGCPICPACTPVCLPCKPLEACVSPPPLASCPTSTTCKPCQNYPITTSPSVIKSSLKVSSVSPKLEPMANLSNSATTRKSSPGSGSTSSKPLMIMSQTTPKKNLKKRDVTSLTKAPSKCKKKCKKKKKCKLWYATSTSKAPNSSTASPSTSSSTTLKPTASSSTTVRPLTSTSTSRTAPPVPSIDVNWNITLVINLNILVNNSTLRNRIKKMIREIPNVVDKEDQARARELLTQFGDQDALKAMDSMERNHSFNITSRHTAERILGHILEAFKRKKCNCTSCLNLNKEKACPACIFPRPACSEEVSECQPCPKPSKCHPQPTVCPSQPPCPACPK